MQPSIATTQLATSGIVVYLLQWLKGAKWFPLLTKETAKLNRWSSAALAALTAWGISYQWAPAHAAGVLGTLSVSIPTLTVLCYGIWHWAVQFVSQETIYRATSGFQLIQDLLARGAQPLYLSAGAFKQSKIPAPSGTGGLPQGPGTPGFPQGMPGK